MRLPFLSYNSSTGFCSLAALTCNDGPSARNTTSSGPTLNDEIAGQHIARFKANIRLPDRFVRRGGLKRPNAPTVPPVVGDIDFSICDRGYAELRTGAKVVARIGRLVAVIKFTRQVARVIGMQNGGVLIFRGPQDAMGCSIGRDAWRGSWKPECVSTSRDCAAIHARIGETERAQHVPYRSEVKPSIEKGRRAEIESPQGPENPDRDVRFAFGIVLPHVIAIRDVDVRIFSGADHQDAVGSRCRPSYPEAALARQSQGQ